MVAFIGVWSEHCMSVTDLFAGLAREFASQGRRKLSSMLSL